MSVRRHGIWGYGYVGCLALAACGGEPASAPPPGGTETARTVRDSFSPPEPLPGYTRLVAPVVDAVPPGGDAIVCQYVLSPFDHDVDVLDVMGYQSRGGHHSIAYAVKNGAEVGTSRPCNTEDNTSIGGFLGGIGGEAGGKAKLPDGIVFRLTKDSTIMLNTHFLNAGTDTIDGQTVLDVKFDEVDPSRRVASIFVNFTMDFTVAPLGKTAADATCTVPRDMQFLSFTNHMHAHGARSTTNVLRNGGAEELLHADPTWTFDMQFNPAFTEWTVGEPFVVKQGDRLTTHCEWENDTANAVSFPDEMCVGFGFFLTEGATSPLCVGGTWQE